MDIFLPYPLVLTLAGGFVGLLWLVLFLNVFGLPANWLILGLTALWQWLMPGPGLGVFFWTMMTVLALAGEALETGLQVLKARKYGSSTSGTFVGMIGAIIGAFVFAPVFWGIGAFIGALAGAWLGCMLMELLSGKPAHEALNAAFGTLMGRFLGTICKIGIGAAMIALTWQRIWPELPPVPALPPGADPFYVWKITAILA